MIPFGVNIYIDCGTHLGEGIALHVKEWSIDESWKIIGFEANPETYKKLIEIKESGKYSDRFKWFSFPHLDLRQSAVWIKDGHVNFGCAEYIISEDDKSQKEISAFLENHEKLLTSGYLLADHVGNERPIDGASSIYSKQMSRFLSKKGDIVQKTIQYTKELSTKSIDFSNFLMTETNSDDKIYCKMDIERAEFKVLEKCIKTGAISRISVIDIEWHDYGNLILRLRKLRILYKLRKIGVVCRDWQ